MKLIALAALTVWAGTLAAQDNARPKPGFAAAAPDIQAAKAGGPNSAPLERRSSPLPKPSFKGGGTGLRVLVFDENANHHYAKKAAQTADFVSTVAVAGASDFNAELLSHAWDVVAVDCPSAEPDGGWQDLVAYIDGGGAAILSYWDWDEKPALCDAFDVSVVSGLDWLGATLYDQETTPLFLGVEMPNSSWDDNWIDDGDIFAPLDGAVKLANADVVDAVLVRGNGGRTIAAPLFDEGPDTWAANSPIHLWQNMIAMVGLGGPEVLVYDEDTGHRLAQKAAFEVSPGGTTTAQLENFNERLTQTTWDVVLVDAPNFPPLGGWGDLADFVNGGGHAVMSFWDWDNSLGAGDPALNVAFEVSPAGDLDLTGQELLDSGVSGVFEGVTMPNSDWGTSWLDDGDRFEVDGLAIGLAHVGNPTKPVMVWGNAGRTVATFLIDELGSVWQSDGSGITLWGNLLRQVTQPKASCTERAGLLGLNPADFTCTQAPRPGADFLAQVDVTPTAGTGTLSTHVGIGLGGPLEGVVAFGYELLILPTYLVSSGFGAHVIPVPGDPTLIGLALTCQGARVELSAGNALIVLTNALDLALGF